MAFTKKQESKNSAFDFRRPEVDAKSSFEDFVKNKEKEFRSKFSYKTNPTSSRAWLIVAILLICLASLGTFTFLEMRENNRLIADLKNQQAQVAGVSETLPETQETDFIEPISGYNVSILPQQTPPQEFQKKTLEKPFEVIPESQALVTTYLAQISTSAGDLLSGVEIQVSEYDNRLNHQDFDKVVLEFLGPDFSIKADNIKINKDFELSKIESDTDNQQITYYTAVTTDYYYLIKLYQQTAEFEEYQEINTFTENILSWIYLN